MNKNLQFLLASNTLFVFAGNLFVPYYSLFVLNVGGKAEIAGILIGIQFLSSFLAGIWIIRLRDKNSLQIKLLKFNFIFRISEWLLLAISPTLSTLIIAQIIGGIAQGIGTPSFNTLISTHLDEKRYMSEWGTWDLMKNLIIAIAGIAGGFIVSFYGFQVLFVIMALFALLSLVICCYQFR